MREILFRAKDEQNRWWLGFPMCDRGKWTMPNSCGAPTAYPINPNTLCEYTGLTDKNGNKIFEGDIFHIEKENYYGVVRYGRYCNPFNDDPDRRHVGFYVEWKNRPELLRKDLAFWSYECEVVGNIFDNPELIGGNIFENH